MDIRLSFMQQIYCHTNKELPIESIEAVDSVEAFGKLIARRVSLNKVFLVHGKGSYTASGAQNLIASAKVLSDSSVIEFFDFTANPHYQDAVCGKIRIDEQRPDAIIAIGGGSVIDMAKLIRYLAADKSLPLVAIPTTSGTGAESTKFAVCYKDGTKQSVESPDMLPDYVLLEPSLTLNNNAYLTACTGFDALAQAIEAYWNINANEQSDRLALEAIQLIYPNLVHQSNDLTWRTNMMIGANLAGQAINITRTTAPHAMSYTLTSKYGYPHGHAVALSFPFFFEQNIRCSKENYTGSDYDIYHHKMNILLDKLNLTDKDDLFDVMKQYTKQMGLSFDSQKPIDTSIVAQGVNPERAKNNPLRLTEEILTNAAKSIII